MIVLGVDPGLTRCGLGVIDGATRSRPRFIAAGVIRSAVSGSPEIRLRDVYGGLVDWIDEYQPAVVVIERVFAQHNHSTVIGTAQAAGLAMLVAAQRGIPVAFHSPSEVKAAVSGSGRAEKAQVGAMVQRIFELDAPPKPADAADALALAITAVWRPSLSTTTAAARVAQTGTSAQQQWAQAEAAARKATAARR